MVIQAGIAELQKYSNVVEANGNILSDEMVELRPEISGRVIYLNIPEGKKVAEGTLLAKLFDEDLQAQLRKAESQLEIARTTLLRLGELLKADGLNKQEYDQANSQVKVLEAEADLVKAQLRKTEIRAPFTGVTGLRRISPGAYITQADVITTMQSGGRMKVDFVLPEKYIHVVKAGDTVKVKMNNGKETNAVVTGVESMIRTSTRNLQLRAVLMNHEGFTAGAFVRVEIDAAKGLKTILVPTNSVIPETRYNKVALIKGGKIELVRVETGYRSQGLVEITSGMSAGDTFAVSGILYLKPGMDVKVGKIVSLK